MECQQRSGFTLIELICVLFISAILVFLVVPGFFSLILSNRLDTQVNQFIIAVNLARSEAIKKNKTVLLCARNGDKCSGIDSWHEGWVVFEDVDRSTNVDKNEAIRWFEPLAQGYTLQPNFSLPALAFKGDGAIRQVLGALPMRTFTFCGPGAVSDLASGAREIVMSRSGRMMLRPGRAGKTVCP
ncbi:MAG: GspH/FimT family pseudopilin [Pseudomonadales bacterium]|nr:GspH/FimT family pseudopilin [Pseudomonadales bacterium]MCP5213875.1 GspH/FimT family pseudopilin [Pseudomonadales bacterium]